MSNVGTKIHNLTDKVSQFMEYVFWHMQSVEERKLSTFILTNLGSPEVVLKNDVLLQKAILTQTKHESSKASDPAGKLVESDDAVPNIAELREEVDKDVDQVIADNKYFDHKFDSMQNFLRVTVRHESDRVITAILSGPHNRIIDQVSFLHE